MATRIPHLLDPYLALPPECAQILLTSVLGASTNWLVLRYLYSYLRRPTEDAPADDTRVVLVSFMRDFAFWKEGAGRLVRLLSSEILHGPWYITAKAIGNKSN